MSSGGAALPGFSSLASPAVQKTDRAAGGPPVHLPRREVSPPALLARRLGLVLALLALVSLLAYFGRAGYRDSAGGEISLIDAIYYATVSITTTGYGDVVPVTDTARLLTAAVVTPVRILFLILLVGTTVEILTERTREGYRRRRWRSGLKDHIIVCGYGTKGRSAVDEMLGRGVDRERIVVVDSDPGAIERANEDGLAAVAGNATSTTVLEPAGVREASSVIVAVNRDDAAVLTTLTVRELNPQATIASAVREEENTHLVREGGANSVISSSGGAGRLLGLATQSPSVVDVLEDLLSVGKGLDIIERRPRPDEVGQTTRSTPGELIVAVNRDGEMIRFDDPRATPLRETDRVVCVCGEGRHGRARAE